MSGDEYVKATAAGAVVPLRKLDEVGLQFFDERAQVSWAAKGDFGFECESRQALAPNFGAFAERGRIANCPRGRGDEIRAGKAILKLGGLDCNTSKKGWIEYPGARSGAHAAFDQATPPPLFDQLDKPGTLELTQVVVDFLTGQVEATRQAAGGVGFSQQAKELTTQGRQGDGAAIGVAQDLAPGDGLGLGRRHPRPTRRWRGHWSTDQPGAGGSVSGISLVAATADSTAAVAAAHHAIGRMGFVYLRARMYDPTTGRFIRRNPIPGSIGVHQ